jgi:serine/threonine protein kinase
LTIDFMHKRNIVHRDIKLDNILISKVEDGESYDIKIADFGLARFMPPSNKAKPREKNLIFE